MGFIVAILALGGFFFARQRSADATKGTIKTAVVMHAAFAKTIQSSGKTKAKKAVELKFSTSGKLTWVGVKEGDHVQAYQAIASLDSREVQKNLEKALRDYSAQRNDFEQTWRMTYKGTKDPQTAFTDTVKRILEENQWDLEKAVLDVELKHLAVEYATLVTPIAGIVTHIDMPYAGVNITPATAVFEVLDPDTLIFEAAIDEIDVGKLALNMDATISLDAFPNQTFPGKISFIAYAAQTSSGGATVFPVEISITSAPGVRVGMNGDVSIATAQQNDALVVPLEAIREDEKGSYVYRKAGKTYEKRPVILGQQNDTVAIVTDGLSEGDEVVVKGFAALP